MKSWTFEFSQQAYPTVIIVGFNCAALNSTELPISAIKTEVILQQCDSYQITILNTKIS